MTNPLYFKLITIEHIKIKKTVRTNSSKDS